MTRRITTPFTTTPVRLAPVAAMLVMLATGRAEAANPTYYDNLAEFQVDVTFTVTDDYSNPGYQFIQSNAVMNAVIGETDYMTTGFQDLNIVSGGYYCAGCNGSFQLSFLTTTVGNAEGVNGVGVDIPVHSMMVPYFAYITFGDGTTADIPLPASGNFWGVSAPERIESIHFGLSMGGSTQSGSFGIDNLIVGDGFDMTPCGDAIVHDDEECDDGGNSPLCDANCTLAVCGDGTPNDLAGEECDTAGASATCDADCTLAVCGDSQVNAAAGETCDDGGESVNCDTDCTAPMCGDDVANIAAGEECDDSAQSPTCDADCTFVVCGDGIENNTAGEFCDDGNNEDGDGCSAVCTNEEPTSTSSEGGESSGDPGTSEGGETTDASAGTDDTGGTEGTGADASASDTAVDTSGGDSGSASASASDTGSTSADGSESSGTPLSGADGSATGGTDEAGGCGCATDDRDHRGLAWSVLTVLGLGAVRRRRHMA